MGAFDSNPRSDLSGVSRGCQHWIPPVEGISVGGVGNLADRFSGLILGDGRNEGVHQIIKAVEDAENTIKQQLEENNLLKKEKLEENNLLKKEILQKTRELENYRLEAMPLRPSDISTNGHVEVYKIHHSNSSAAIESDRNRWLENHPTLNPQSMLVLHENGVAGREKPSVETATSNQPYYEINKVNGDLKKFPGLPSALDNAGPSQYSTPSSRSVSPSRHQKDGEHDRRFSLSGNGLVPVSDLHSNIPWKQELIIKVREHEDEIAQLKKHLADYSLKEAQIRNEKYVLEKRIAYMRMAFDQQQQELVDAASKAISYRQDIIEENIRLTYALQAAQAERSTFVSSFVPLLSEHGLQPSAVDAQSIVGNLKVLFRHMQEKLFIAEERMKESQYLMAPWYAESSNNAGFPSQSPYHPTGTQVALPNKNSLEIVPQPYSNAQLVPNSHTRHEWKAVGNQNQQPNTGSVPTKNLDQDALETNTLSIRRDHSAHDTSETNQSETRSARLNVDSKSQHLSFKHLVKSVRGDESETVPQHGKEPSVQWAPGTSAYLPSGQDEPNAYTYLPTVLEERSSSFSEADDEPLPAIDGLQISGEAYPGRELQASGYQINGTTSCNFEWVRYLEDGSVHYIDGAKQPNYLVTADDVDSYLAIEVQPLDDRKRKGELVKVFANEQRKITCDPDMQELIKSTLSVGHASYEVSLSTRFLDIWEPAVLAIKREGYSIKCSGPRVVVTEKFQQNTTILIPYGHPTEFLIQDASGEFLLKTEESTLRDTIVLTMRCFKMKASEKRKGRKKGLFFK